jgi:hypothetical protein
MEVYLLATEQSKPLHFVTESAVACPLGKLKNTEEEE